MPSWMQQPSCSSPTISEAILRSTSLGVAEGSSGTFQSLSTMRSTSEMWTLSSPPAEAHGKVGVDFDDDRRRLVADGPGMGVREAEVEAAVAVHGRHGQHGHVHLAVLAVVAGHLVVEDGHEPAEPLVVGLAIMPTEVKIVIGEMLRRGVRLDASGIPMARVVARIFTSRSSPLRAARARSRATACTANCPYSTQSPERTTLTGLFGLDEFLLCIRPCNASISLPSAAGCRR